MGEGNSVQVDTGCGNNLVGAAPGYSLAESVPGEIQLEAASGNNLAGAAPCDRLVETVPTNDATSEAVPDDSSAADASAVEAVFGGNAAGEASDDSPAGDVPNDSPTDGMPSDSPAEAAPGWGVADDSPGDSDDGESEVDIQTSKRTTKTGCVILFFVILATYGVYSFL